jgi:hypothetical protein
MTTHDKSVGTQPARTAPQPRDDRSARVPPAGQDPVQGEGDYEAARRHRESATGFVRSHDIEAEAREAAPRTADDARALLEAERQGRARTRGEDRRDVMQENVDDAAEEPKGR